MAKLSKSTIKKTKSEIGREMSGLRDRTIKGTCSASDCGKDFTGLSTKKYCGNRCKQQAKNERYAIKRISDEKKKVESDIKLSGIRH